MEHIYSPKQFGKLIGKSVNTLQKWDRKGILPASRTPTILHARTVFRISWPDCFRPRKNHRVCSCVLPLPTERPCHAERSTSRLLSGTSDQSRSMGGRYWFRTQLQTKRLQ